MQKLLFFLPGITRVVSNATPLFIIFAFSKLIDTASLGELNYFLALITLIGVFTDFGLPEAIQRFVQQKDGKKYISATLAVETAVVLFGAVVVIILDLLTAGEITRGQIFLLPLIIIFSASNTYILVFNGLQKDKIFNLMMLGNATLFVLLTFGLFFAGLEPVESFLWGRLLSWIIFSVVPILILAKQNLLGKIHLSKRFILFGLNSFVIVFSYAVLNQWDSIIVTQFRGEAVNGIYKSVAVLATVPNVLAVILQTRLLPEYSKLVAQGEVKKTIQSMSKYTLLGLGITATSLIVAQLFNSDILALFYTSEIADFGQQYFAIILAGSLFYVSAVPAMMTLYAIGRESLLRNITVVQVIIYLLFSTIIVAFQRDLFELAILFAAVNLLLLVVVNIAGRQLLKA